MACKSNNTPKKLGVSVCIQGPNYCVLIEIENRYAQVVDPIAFVLVRHALSLTYMKGSWAVL